MIIECETCHTKFKLDESRLRREGSKVRCSRCKAVFITYPPTGEAAPTEEPEVLIRESFQETVALDSPVSAPEEKVAPPEEPSREMDFEKAFDQSLGDREEFKPMAPEDLKDLFAETEEGGAPEGEVPVSRKAAGEAVAAAPKPALEKGAVLQPRRTRVSSLVVLLILLVLFAGGGAAVYFLFPQVIPDSLSFLKPAPQPATVDPGVRRLAFKAVTGSFLDAKAGSLFLIRGEVSNNYPQSRSYILVKASLLDEKGQTLRTKTAYAGNTFTDEEIKARPIQEIDKAIQNRGGQGGKNVNVAQGASVPFVLVFDSLPGNLSEFTIEAVSSSPGTK